MTVTNHTGGMIEGGGATAAAIQGGPDTTMTFQQLGTIKAAAAAALARHWRSAEAVTPCRCPRRVVPRLSGTSMSGPEARNRWSSIQERRARLWNKSESVGSDHSSSPGAQIKRRHISRPCRRRSGSPPINGGKFSLAGKQAERVGWLPADIPAGKMSPGNSAPGRLTVQTQRCRISAAAATTSGNSGGSKTMLTAHARARECDQVLGRSTGGKRPSSAAPHCSHSDCSHHGGERPELSRTGSGRPEP